MALTLDHGQVIRDLEARHDELFGLLADLEKRVADVLAQYQAVRPEVGPAASAAIPPATSEPIRAAAA